jgi:hypothetical protein
MRFKALLHRDRREWWEDRHNAMHWSGSRTLRASRSSRRSAGSARCFNGLYTQTASPCERLGAAIFHRGVSMGTWPTCYPSLSCRRVIRVCISLKTQPLSRKPLSPQPDLLFQLAAPPPGDSVAPTDSGPVTSQLLVGATEVVQKTW